tara:strand:+ start:272 stop:541 length:270 start_codon:yes stop_codon:yes gene_type:complete
MPIDKNSEEYRSTRCSHILTKGARKGLQCDNRKCLDSDKCKSHCRLVAKVKPEKVEVKPEKVEVKPEKVKVKPEKVKPKSKSKAVQVLE